VIVGIPANNFGAQEPGTTGGEIGWNFTKFLVGPDGKVLARFDSAVEPDSPQVTSAVEKPLASLKSSFAGATTRAGKLCNSGGHDFRRAVNRLPCNPA
jgi:hypothetical protein